MQAKSDGLYVAWLLSLERLFQVQYEDFLGKFQQIRFIDAYIVNYYSCWIYTIRPSLLKPDLFCR